VKYVLEVPDSINARLKVRADQEHVTARALLVWLIKGELFEKTSQESGTTPQPSEGAVA